MRAVNVDALRPCSAAEIQYVSTATTRSRIRLAAPADQELRRRVLAVGDLRLRHRRLLPARRLSDDRERRSAEPREVVARLLGRDVDELAEPPLRPERGETGLQIRRDRPARILQLDLLRVRHAGLEPFVDQQPPDLLERVVADQILDVDAAIPERPTLFVGLGDLRLEGDNPLETGLEVACRAHRAKGT